MSNDAIDELWNVLHPRPRNVSAGVSDLPVEPISKVSGLPLVKGVHLVLAQNHRDLCDAVDEIRAVIPKRYSIATLESDIPCLIYGDDHWKVIEYKLEGLFESKKQAFIGTMNTFAIDCFYFESAADVRDRLLFAGKRGHLWSMSEIEAEAFYQSYKVGIQHTSEVLRTGGWW